jgi:DNA-directed RNA polymerase subunit RPC12/RpoP
MEKYRRFLYCRYGHDKLNRFISFAALGLCAISFFARSLILTVAIFALLIISAFRSLSKNHARRMLENRMYERAARPVKRFFRYWHARIKTHKTHRIYTCAKCRSILRIPKESRDNKNARVPRDARSTRESRDAEGRRGGKPAPRLEIKCPKCGEKFIK